MPRTRRLVPLHNARLALEQHNSNLLAPQHNATALALMRVVCVLPAVYRTQVGSDGKEQCVKHARAVAHVVVGVVACELKRVACERAQRTIHWREDEQLRGERERLELDKDRLRVACEGWGDRAWAEWSAYLITERFDRPPEDIRRPSRDARADNAVARPRRVSGVLANEPQDARARLWMPHIVKAVREALDDAEHGGGAGRERSELRLNE
jgi:hypothetical protein